MALVRIEDGDPWLTEYESCDKLFREIMEQLTLRNRESRTSQNYASLSANIRLRMKQYSGEVEQLKSKVDEDFKMRSITREEAERRWRQIEQLQSKDVQLQQLYNARSSSLASDRARLMQPNSSAFADMGTTSWGLEEDDDQPIDIQVSVEDLKVQKLRLLQEQDEGLEALSKVISRQKDIANTINNEVDHQNEIIDDLADHMERTDQRLINGTRQVGIIDRKDRTCGYWIVIILLFISIIAVAVV
ncbi:syntaxin-8 [Neodiprion pinetum]|uniref:Syntaxin-8 n=1 Tax=Neodiprion lecontei TaxID=441921 RepID=A0A6J0BNG0_NEOLC|nr:syntaxin-8 [Neodiprion lecontei]XP_046423623.1 syntaxin-8 [Neodiprion fabricii]XP_046476036.1 syntaxin-8 [Neodiprion pinetum]XP_046614558.1 syntaxin-8 [Neodiprion virginianus]